MSQVSRRAFLLALPGLVAVARFWRPATAPTPPSFTRGTGGLRDFGPGTLAMLHGREAVITSRQLSDMLRANLRPVRVAVGTA